MAGAGLESGVGLMCAVDFDGKGPQPETLLAQVIDLVVQAQKIRVPLQGIAAGQPVITWRFEAKLRYYCPRACRSV